MDEFEGMERASSADVASDDAPPEASRWETNPQGRSVEEDGVTHPLEPLESVSAALLSLAERVAVLEVAATKADATSAAESPQVEAPASVGSDFGGNVVQDAGSSEFGDSGAEGAAGAFTSDAESDGTEPRERAGSTPKPTIDVDGAVHAGHAHGRHADKMWASDLSRRLSALELRLAPFELGAPAVRPGAEDGTRVLSDDVSTEQKGAETTPQPGRRSAGDRGAAPASPARDRRERSPKGSPASRGFASVKAVARSSRSSTPGSPMLADETPLRTADISGWGSWRNSLQRRPKKRKPVRFERKSPGTPDISPNFGPVGSSDEDSDESEAQNAANVSFWRFVSEEMNWGREPGVQHHSSPEFMLNFMVLPVALEKFMVFAFLCCLDVFLHVFTYLPCRFIAAAFALAKRAIQGRKASVFHRVQLYDLIRGVIVIVSALVLTYVQISRVYHYIRGEAAIRLYVIFNILEILDRLFCSIGQDAMDSLYRVIRDTPHEYRRLGFYAVVAIFYVVAHSTVLFVQIVTLNVAINSKNNALLTLLVSNNLVELKASIFKRFESENLFQMSCSDAVERFHLFLFLCLICLQDAESWQSAVNFLPTAVIVYTGECAVDWVKHLFVTKFNRLHGDTYLQFTTILSHDVIVARRRMRASLDPTHSSVRRMGFASLPLACVLVRVVSNRMRDSVLFSWDALTTPLGISVVVAGVACVFALKLLITLVMLVAASYIGDGGLGQRRRKGRNIDEQLLRIARVSRYSLYNATIPFV